MRVYPLLLIAALSLAACERAGSDIVTLPLPKTYPQETLDRAADELETLPADSALAGMIADYAVIREQLRTGQ